MAEKEYMEGAVFVMELRDIGNSHYLLIDENMKKYLGLEGKNPKVVLKADKGRHGPFWGVGKAKE